MSTDDRPATDPAPEPTRVGSDPTARLAFCVTQLLGELVTVEMRDGTRFQGLLVAVGDQAVSTPSVSTADASPPPGGLGLELSQARLLPGPDSALGSSAQCHVRMPVAAGDYVLVEAADTVLATDGSPTTPNAAGATRSPTEGLRRWSEMTDDSAEALEGPGGHREGSWNQFEANKRLGVTTSYREDMYTTKLESTKLTPEQLEAAAELERQINARSSRGVQHDIERGRGVEGDEGLLFSDVARGGTVGSVPQLSVPHTAAPAPGDDLAARANAPDAAVDDGGALVPMPVLHDVGQLDTGRDLAIPREWHKQPNSLARAFATAVSRRYVASLAAPPTWPHDAEAGTVEEDAGDYDAEQYEAILRAPAEPAVKVTVGSMLQQSPGPASDMATPQPQSAQQQQPPHSQQQGQTAPVHTAGNPSQQQHAQQQPQQQPPQPTRQGAAQPQQPLQPPVATAAPMGGGALPPSPSLSQEQLALLQQQSAQQAGQPPSTPGSATLPLPPFPGGGNVSQQPQHGADVARRGPRQSRRRDDDGAPPQPQHQQQQHGMRGNRGAPQQPGGFSGQPGPGTGGQGGPQRRGPQPGGAQYAPQQPQQHMAPPQGGQLQHHQRHPQQQQYGQRQQGQPQQVVPQYGSGQFPQQQQQPGMPTGQQPQQQQYPPMMQNAGGGTAAGVPPNFTGGMQGNNGGPGFGPQPTSLGLPDMTMHMPTVPPPSAGGFAPQGGGMGMPPAMPHQQQLPGGGGGGGPYQQQQQQQQQQQPAPVGGPSGAGGHRQRYAGDRGGYADPAAGGGDMAYAPPQDFGGPYGGGASNGGRGGANGPPGHPQQMSGGMRDGGSGGIDVRGGQMRMRRGGGGGGNGGGGRRQ